MEETPFDLLLRRAAQQTTRRKAVGALIAGAALLTRDGAIEATKKAERRKRRERSANLSKPIALWLDNSAGTRAVAVTNGDQVGGQCCSTINTVVVPAGERKRGGLSPQWGSCG